MAQTWKRSIWNISNIKPFSNIKIIKWLYISAPQKIIDLVSDFEENKHEYKNPEIFDEENTKVKFLNPFFEELGWNIRNEGLSAKFREVVFEDTIKMGNKTKAPDYSFRLGGKRIFFVEAKKPIVT